jgi:hypothetical protein
MDKATNQLWNALDEEVVQLCGRWKLYNQLFASGKENIDLLNKTASYVFFQLQRSMVDSVILTLSKLTDPAKTGKYENASLDNFLKKLKGNIDNESLARFQTQLGNLTRICENIRTHRNKRIGHSDIKCALEDAEWLPPVTHADIDSALEVLCRMMKDIMLVLFDLERGDDPDFQYGSDGNHLFYILRKAYSGK